MIIPRLPNSSHHEGAMNKPQKHLLCCAPPTEQQSQKSTICVFMLHEATDESRKLKCPYICITPPEKYFQAFVMSFKLIFAHPVYL